MASGTIGSGADDGILLVAHGTVESLDDIPDFLLKIRRGRPPAPELIAELRHRYERIGGSPLLEITRAQASALAARARLPVFVGMRLWRPGVEDALREASAQGVRRLALVPLAPFSVDVYHEAALAALARVKNELAGPVTLARANPWGTDPSFVAAHARRIRAALVSGPGAALVLTAHSLPRAVILAGDGYAAEVERSAAAIGAALGVKYTLAYQSQGAVEGEWLGPDLRSVLAGLAAQECRRVVIAPFGFLADHVETLFDLDVEAAGWARELDIELTRVPALNTDPGLIEALHGLALRSLSGGGD